MSRGLGAFEITISVIDKCNPQKTEIFTVRTQDQWSLWKREIAVHPNVLLQGNDHIKHISASFLAHLSILK